VLGSKTSLRQATISALENGEPGTDCAPSSTCWRLWILNWSFVPNEGFRGNDRGDFLMARRRKHLPCMCFLNGRPVGLLAGKQAVRSIIRYDADWLAWETPQPVQPLASSREIAIRCAAMRAVGVVPENRSTAVSAQEAYRPPVQKH